MAKAPLTTEIVLRTLAIGLVGGIAFYELGLPLPWLSGPAASVAAAAVSRVPVGIPAALRETAIVLLGATLGSAVTPETLAMLPRWPITLTGLILAMVAVMGSGSIYLERVHGFDRLTARLSSVPGAMNYVLALAAASDSDLRKVTIIQVVRLTAILIFVPGLFNIFGLHFKSNFARAGSLPVHWGELIILLALSFASAALFRRLKAPAPSLFGAMAVAAVLFSTGLMTTGIPVALALPGFLVLGSMIGSNFAGTDKALLINTLAAGLGSLAVSATAAVAIAVPVALMVGMPVTQLWLAYAPGGVETTALLAMAMGLDAAFISGHHVARVVFLSLMVPLWIGRDVVAARQAREKA